MKWILVQVLGINFAGTNFAYLPVLSKVYRFTFLCCTFRLFRWDFRWVETSLDSAKVSVKSLHFLQGVSVAANPVLAIVGKPSIRLSIRLSRWHWVKTTQARITKSSPTDSPRTLVFRINIHPEIRKGSPRARALNESGVGKIRNFQPISHRISETVQDRTKVTINH